MVFPVLGTKPEMNSCFRRSIRRNLSVNLDIFGVYDFFEAGADGLRKELFELATSIKKSRLDSIQQSKRTYQTQQR